MEHYVSTVTKLGWDVFILDSKHQDLSPSTPPVNTALHSQLEDDLKHALAWTKCWSRSPQKSYTWTKYNSTVITLRQKKQMKGFFYLEHNAEINWTTVCISKMGIIWPGRALVTFNCSPYGSRESSEIFLPEELTAFWQSAVTQAWCCHTA